MKILTVTAHYDDLELAAGGFIYNLSKSGEEVHSIITSSSGYTNYKNEVVRSDEIADKEGRTALWFLGVKSVINLGYDTKNVPYEPSLIERINETLDTLKPNLIITHHINDTHPSHSNTAKATISAARYYNNIIMTEPLYPSNIAYRTSFKPQVYVDITNSMKTKLASLEYHRGEYINHSFWNRLVLALNTERGIESGCEYAEAFEPVKMRWDILK